ncbi:MAG: sulfur carrier protein ThiS [Gammaproteobacteria bacterium]|nr:MAG: sulfur carrier protein ThiS [Gammaproteobacteria bacterium]
MQIFVNGQARDVSEGCNVTQLLMQLDMAGRRCALEINREIVPRSAYATRRLRSADQVEIIHAVGGG